MIDKQALLEEIRAFRQAAGAGDALQEGDLTFADLENGLGICHQTAQRLARDLVASGQYQRLDRVRAPDGRRLTVLRKVNRQMTPDTPEALNVPEFGKKPGSRGAQIV